MISQILLLVIIMILLVMMIAMTVHPSFQNLMTLSLMVSTEYFDMLTLTTML